MGTDQIEKTAPDPEDDEKDPAVAAAEKREAEPPAQELGELTDEDKSYLSEAELKQMEAERAEEEAAEAAAKAAEEEAAKAAEAKDDEPEEEPEPAPAIPDTAEAERKAEDLAKQRDALLDQYEEGELTREEWRKQSAEIEDQIVDARAAVKAAQDRRAEQEQAELTRWHREVDSYLGANPTLKEPAHLRGFDQVLRSVTASDTYAHLPWSKQIETAHKMYAVHAESIGAPIPMPGGGKAEEPAKAQDPEKLERRTDPRPTTPTLASLPQSDPGGANESRFAGVDRLIDSDDPHAAEHALERMSDEERARFLNGA